MTEKHYTAYADDYLKMVNAFKKALDQCVKVHGEQGPSICKWLILCPSRQSDEKGSVTWIKEITK